MTTTTKALKALETITDEDRIVAAEYGTYQTYPLSFWDDGYGPIWIYRESLGVRGIVRARTWEDAYSCVEDEIMDDADPDYLANPGYDVPEGELPEGCHYRSNGIPSNPRLKTAIAQEDLNGSYLEPLTASIAAEYGIRIYVETE